MFKWWISVVEVVIRHCGYYKLSYNLRVSCIKKERDIALCQVEIRSYCHSFHNIMTGKSWKVIALTCGPTAGCDALQRELKARQSKGLIDKDTLTLVIDDPVKGIGSGGATLNALLVIAENLAAQAGYTVVNSDVLDDAHILILHVGGHYMFNGTGRAFVNIPRSTSDITSSSADDVISFDYGLMTTLDHLILLMTNQVSVCVYVCLCVCLSVCRIVAAGAPPGVWICSTDMILSIPQSFKIDWSAYKETTDVLALSIRGDIVGAQRHGVYVTDDEGYVKDILYRRDTEKLHQFSHPDGTVNVVVGVVYFNKKVVEKLLSFTNVSPLNNCTYVGIDSGAKPLRVSLFFDLIYAMCGKVAAYSAVTVQMPAELYQVKWRLLTSVLSDLRVKTASVEGGQFHYIFNDLPSFQSALGSMTGKEPSENVVKVNSVISADVQLPQSAYISNCLLTCHVRLSTGVTLSGVDTSIYQPGQVLALTSNMVYQHLRVSLNEQTDIVLVPVIFGGSDSFTETFESGTFCNDSWEKFFAKVDCTANNIWSPSCKPEDRTLGNARLYPVMSLGCSGYVYADTLMWMQPGETLRPSLLSRWKSSWRLSLVELMQIVDYEEEFSWRRRLYADLAQAKVKDVIESHGECSLIPLYKSISCEQTEHCVSLLETLDTVAMESDSPGIAGRALANIADVLGCMAGLEGGLRSGPSANAVWKQAYDLLERGDVKEGVAQLAAIRTRWLTGGYYLIRAARHYEGAAQILIRRAVASANQFIVLEPKGELPAIGRWIIGESPARADIAGGWSDTPPISYEHGGAVTNCALLVDGKKPIGCKVRRIEQPHLVIVMNSGSDSTKIVISDVDQLRDYYQPQSPGALLKTAFICSKIVNLDCELNLEQQLVKSFGGGFELHTWSNLPHGSGLGTSSILAGVVMGVLWTASATNFTVSSLIHCVLHVEQMMTTGGGWQDQVGGLVPGVKIGFSKAELPLYVDYRPVELPKDFIRQFDERLLLIYTGKTRLARNLLQNVVRNWYARDPHIVQTTNNLVRIAYECEQAFKNCDLLTVGKLGQSTGS
ncbi:FUK [Bugula neritina]|uniref:FUK n=1 Tax=Bugula neritina TaxID=10212 RepID=A0A7J7JMY5_BUGNE|nr:FUK [Bugula neritina]